MEGETYPMFDVDENGVLYESGYIDEEGNIVSYSGAATEPQEGAGAQPEGEAPDVSAGDSGTGAPGNVIFVSNELDSGALDGIQSDVSYLAAQQASASGYLSSSAVDVFDRVVNQYEYDYYCAYRYDNDSYNSMLYLADHCSVNGRTVTLEDALQVRLYRQYASGGSYNYYYYYTVQEVGDTDISLGTNLMYYTNCVDGYPSLGNVPRRGNYPAAVVLIVAAVLFAVFFAFRRSRK